MNIPGLILQMISAIAGLGTLFMAWLALKSWRHQLIAQANLDVARRLRLAAHRVLGEIQDCRYGISQENYGARLRCLRELTAELDSAATEAASLWDIPVEDRVNDLYLHVAEFRTGVAHRFGDGWTDLPPERQVAISSIVHGDESDPFAKRLAQAVKALDALTIQYIKL